MTKRSNIAQKYPGYQSRGSTFTAFPSATGTQPFYLKNCDKELGDYYHGLKERTELAPFLQNPVTAQRPVHVYRNLGTPWTVSQDGTIALDEAAAQNRTVLAVTLRTVAEQLWMENALKGLNLSANDRLMLRAMALFTGAHYVFDASNPNFAAAEMHDYEQFMAANFPKEPVISRKEMRTHSTECILTGIAADQGLNAADHIRTMIAAAPFLAPAEILMTWGGDHRSRVTEKEVSVLGHTLTVLESVYGGTTKPVRGLVSLGSSTLNVLDERNFLELEKERQSILTNHLRESKMASSHSRGVMASAQARMQIIFEERMDAQRQALREYLDLDSTIETFTSPTGTDTEFIPGVFAVARALTAVEASLPPGCTLREFLDDLKPGNEPVAVMTLGRAGSGTNDAAVLKVFDAVLPSSDKAEKGSRITGVPQNFISENPMSVSERSREDLQKDVKTFLTRELRNSDRRQIELHVILGDKLQSNFVDLAFVQELKRLARELNAEPKLLIVVDAAQMRVDKRVLSGWVNEGCVVMVSGSKFLSGLPFSGMVLMTKSQVTEWTGYFSTSAGTGTAEIVTQIVGSLGEWFTRFDVSPALAAFRNLWSDRINAGLYFRWQSAVNIMLRFAGKAQDQTQIAATARNPIARIRQMIRETLNEMNASGQNAFLSLYEPEMDARSVDQAEPEKAFSPSINGIAIQLPDRKLGTDELKQAHRYMTLDLLDLILTGEKGPQAFPDLMRRGEAAAALRDALARPFLLGQPVDNHLRMSANLAMLADLDEQTMRDQFGSALLKLQWVAQNFDPLTSLNSG